MSASLDCSNDCIIPAGNVTARDFITRIGLSLSSEKETVSPSCVHDEREGDLPESVTSGKRRRRPSILIVEDNRSDVFLIREAMAEAGIDANLHVIQDGNQATQFFDEVDSKENAMCPDLVLLDLNLPKRSGNEVLQHMRRSRTCSNARVLVVTSSDSARERQAVDALGCNGYFRKPSEYNEFLKLGSLVRQQLSELE